MPCATIELDDLEAIFSIVAEAIIVNNLSHNSTIKYSLRFAFRGAPTHSLPFPLPSPSLSSLPPFPLPSSHLLSNTPASLPSHTNPCPTSTSLCRAMAPEGSPPILGLKAMQKEVVSIPTRAIATAMNAQEVVPQAG